MEFSTLPDLEVVDRGLRRAPCRGGAAAQGRGGPPHPHAPQALAAPRRRDSRRRAARFPEIRVRRGRGQPPDGQSPPPPRPRPVAPQGTRRGSRRMSARDAILGKIRRSLHVDGSDVGRRAIVIARLEGAPRSVIPARGQLPPRRADRAVHADGGEGLGHRGARRRPRRRAGGGRRRSCASHNLPATCAWATTRCSPACRGSGPRSRSSAARPTATTRSGSAMPSPASPKPARWCSLSGPTTRRRSTSCPRRISSCVAAADIAGDYETVWDRLRARYGKGALPRTVNMVTGPSRSADIEQTLLLGAHGPRRLHIIVVG